MRVAILHDHLSFIGGGERVVLTLASALGADLYATDVDPNIPAKAGFPRVLARELAEVPQTPLLRQTRQARAFARAELPAYDAYVLSGNWAIAAAGDHHPNLWYCHTPVRVFYDLETSFRGALAPAKRVAARAWIRRARPRYEAHVARGWLSVNRLSHEKRIGLQVEAFRRLPRERLVIAGGPGVGVDADTFIRSLRPPGNVTFLGEVDEPRLRELYATCRGFLATAQDEDFGMTPVEAMAAGKAVVAADEGGYRETVVHGETGWLVPPTPEAVAAAISAAPPERLEALRPRCEARAREFDASRFVEGMRARIERIAAAR